MRGDKKSSAYYPSLMYNRLRLRHYTKEDLLHRTSPMQHPWCFGE